MKTFADLETLDDLKIDSSRTQQKRDENKFTTKPSGARFVENCPKCRGSGNFIGYSGRVVGPCRPCRGTGKMTYTSSPEVRAMRKQKAEEKKQKKIDDRRRAALDFSEKNPDVMSWIKRNPGFGFAQSMATAISQWGGLTPGQLAGVQKCIAGEATRAAEQAAKVAAAPAIECSKIMQAFENARAAQLKWPKLVIAQFTFKPAPLSGKNAGSVYVTEGEVYLGRITREAKFLCTRECGAEREAKVIATCADPYAAAVAHGLATGQCACCGRELTNPESIERGIGPICAQKWFGF